MLALERHYNLDVEDAVLSSMLCDGSCIPEILAYLNPGDFCREENRYVMGAFFSLSQKSLPVDVVTLAAELERSGTLAKAGGYQRVIEIAGSFLTSANVACHARELRRLSNARKIVRLAESVIKGETEATAEALMGRMGGLAESPGAEADGLGHHGPFAENFFEDRPSLKTGFANIDRTMGGGIAVPSVLVVGAYSSTGKTAFALNIAAAQDGPVAFFSLEMGAPKIIERLVSAGLKIHYGKIQKRRITPDETLEMQGLLEKLRRGGFSIFDDAYYVEQHESAVAKLKPRLAVVDYLQLVRTHHRAESKRLQVDHVSGRYQAMAKRHGCAVIVLSQLSRPAKAVKKHRPTMSELKESGGIENDADYVGILHRDYVLDKGNKDIREEDAYLLIDKNRYGLTGSIKLEFVGKYQKFYEKDFQGEGLSHVDARGDGFDEF